MRTRLEYPNYRTTENTDNRAGSDSSTASRRPESFQARSAEWAYIGYQNLRSRSWKPLLNSAGLRRSVRFYDLHHTCVTLLLSRGVPVQVAPEMLGHGDAAITLALY